MIVAVLILAVVLFIICFTVLLRQNLSLKKKVLSLEKEIEIQASRLTYQKKQYSESATYFSSAELTIMEMLQQINDALKSEQGDLPEKILQVIFEQAKLLFKPKKCILFKIELAQNASLRLFSSGYSEEQLRSLNLSLDANNSFLGWSATAGRFLSFDDAEQDSILRHLIKSDPLGCHYSQPLKVGNQVRAVLCLGPLAQEMQKDVIVQLFSILSNITSVALSNALLTQGLRERSIRDSLTGLYNHSYFQRCLDTALSDLREKGGVFSLAIVDVDHFKLINDTYGHQAGDIILKTVGGLLNNLNACDYICARYGGDEFGLIFRGRDARQTLAIMESVRKKILKEVFDIKYKRIAVTFSIGIKEAQGSESKKINKKDLITSVDRALYRAKSEGRNRIVMA